MNFNQNTITLVAALGGAVIGSLVMGVLNYIIGIKHHKNEARNRFELETLELMIKYQEEFQFSLGNFSAISIETRRVINKYNLGLKGKGLSKAINFVTVSDLEAFLLNFKSNEFLVINRYINLFSTRYSVLVRFEEHIKYVEDKQNLFLEKSKELLEYYEKTIIDAKNHSCEISEPNINFLSDKESVLIEILTDAYAYINDINTHYSNMIMRRYYWRRKKPLREVKDGELKALERKITPVKNGENK